MHLFGLEAPFFKEPLRDVPDKFANYDSSITSMPIGGPAQG